MFSAILPPMKSLLAIFFGTHHRPAQTHHLRYTEQVVPAWNNFDILEDRVKLLLSVFVIKSSVQIVNFASTRLGRFPICRLPPLLREH